MRDRPMRDRPMRDRPMHLARILAIVVLLVAVVGASGCNPQIALGIMPGVLNDPQNLTLRREILAFGTKEICAEMLRRSVPLRLRDGDPTIGRFYPTSCVARELETGNLLLQFGGFGYGWSNLTQRVGFDVEAAVEYAQDFQLDGSTMYIYFRQRATTAKKFSIKMVERVGGTIGPFGDSTSIATTFGQQILETELTRGFTVVRDTDGNAEFGPGIVPPGQHVPAPYKRVADDHLLLLNERTEIHQNQRDYLGPFVVEDSDMALYLTMLIEGAPAVDVIIVPRNTGDGWLSNYTLRPTLEPPPMPLVGTEPVYGGAIWRRTIPVPKGVYFVVVDNSPVGGITNPTTYAYDDRAVLVSAGVELGDAP